jgi:asparagine synthase (glutamine-hydrolysing)
VCGIAGLVGLNRSLATRRVSLALTRLVHRGPDGQGYHESTDAVLGMRRLAIIDLAAGDQPIYNEDRSIAVVCNGELYNYVEDLPKLQRRGHRLQSGSDVNLIPHLYEELGREAFTRLRGMFAAAVWDERSHSLTLARDRVGKKPLFYAQVRDGLAFASELPALLALLDYTPELSHEALGDFLRLGCVPHPETIYHGVRSLPPGCSLTFRPGESPQITPYWQPYSPAPFLGTRADAITELDWRIREAVSLRLRSDVPVGLLLSGGIDSGLVASYAAELGAKDLLCFVVDVADDALNEAPAARLTASHLGLPIEMIPLQVAPLEVIEKIATLYGQPYADSSAVPTYLVAKAASAHRKVVLNGDGGDEILAGYRRYWAARAYETLKTAPAAVRRGLAALGEKLGHLVDRRSPVGFAARTLRGMAATDAERYLMWTQDLFGEGDLARCFPALASEGSADERLLRLRGQRLTCGTLREFLQSDYRLILVDFLLSKMDIATMAHSLEARAPFLDVPLAEFTWSLPERWLISLTQTKPLLRALAHGRLPRHVATARKRGFEVPVRRWLAGDLRDLVSDVLLASDSRVAQLGEPRAVRGFVQGHDAFAGNRPQAIWCLLMLELYLRAPTPPSAPTPSAVVGFTASPER